MDEIIENIIIDKLALLTYRNYNVLLEVVKN